VIPEQETMVSEALTRLLNEILLLWMGFQRAGNEEGLAIAASLYHHTLAAEEGERALPVEDQLAWLNGLAALAEGLVALAGERSGQSN
jgi:hypothetical protein